MVLPRPWPAKVFPRPRIDTTLNQGGTRVHLSNANQLIKTHIIISILYRYRPNCICAEGAGGGCSCFRHGEDPPPPPQAPCNFARPTFEFRCSPLHPKAALHLLFLSSIKIFTELPLSHLPDYHLRPDPERRPLHNVGAADFGYGASRLDSRHGVTVVAPRVEGAGLDALRDQLGAMAKAHPELEGTLTLASTTIKAQQEEIQALSAALFEVKGALGKFEKEVMAAGEGASTRTSRRLCSSCKVPWRSFSTSCWTSRRCTRLWAVRPKNRPPSKATWTWTKPYLI